MKKNFTLIAFLALICTQVKASIFDNYTVDPAEGTVTSLQSFTITWTDATEDVSMDFSTPSATLMLPDGSVVTSNGRSQASGGEHWNAIKIDFPQNYTAEGEYILTLPAGFSYLGEEKNSELNIRYTVSASTDEETPYQPTDFRNGILLLNEDWFGHTSSSMNYLENGEVWYNVYRGANTDHCLGNTSQYGQVFGDYVFVMSKQSYSEDGRTGGRLIVMDATTLKCVKEWTTLPGNGDGRGVCAANAHKAYVGTSGGFYALNLDTWELSDEQLAPTSSPGQSGDMIRLGKYVFVALEDLGVAAVDPTDDSATLLELPNVAGFVVMHDGTLYAACSDANGEFVKINPWTLETEVVDIEGSHGITSPWSSWHPAQICADKEKNCVYYVTSSGWTISSVSAYNFDTKDFTEEYISVPSNQQIYGQISTDPSTGYVMMTTCQNGWGTNYEHNWIYSFDTNTGAFDDSKTIKFKEYYWFPSMILYNNYTAPEIASKDYSITLNENTTISLPEITTLASGNKNRILYSVEVSNPDIAEVSINESGDMTITGLNIGSTDINIAADYQGRIGTQKVVLTVNQTTGIENVESTELLRDVWTATGRLLLKDATEAEIRNLPSGIYIIGNKKVVIR